MNKKNLQNYFVALQPWIAVVILWAACTPVRAADYSATSSSAVFPPTSSAGPSVDSNAVKNQVFELYNQRKLPLATNLTVRQPAVVPNSQTLSSQTTPERVSQNAAVRSQLNNVIKDNVSRLYGEKLPGMDPRPLGLNLENSALADGNPVSVLPTQKLPGKDNISSMIVGVSPIDELKTASPVETQAIVSPAPSQATVAQEQPGTPIVAAVPIAVTARVAPPVVSMAAPVAAATAATVSATVSASSKAAASIAPLSQDDVVLPRKAAAPLIAQADVLSSQSSVSKVAAKPVIAGLEPSSLVTAKTPATFPSKAAQTKPIMASDTMGNAQDVLSDEWMTSFLRNISGSGGVSLNVVDAVSPADVQAPMHLGEAVAFSLRNNFEVQAANEKSNGAYWDKMGAYAQYVPSVNTTYSSGAEHSNPASVNDAEGNRVLDSQHHRRDHSWNIRQPLIDTAIIADIVSGHDKQDLADNDNYDVREGIAYDTVSVYLSLLQARLAVHLTDEYKAYLDDLATRMKARVEGGGGTIADLDRIHGRVLTAEAARVEALGEYQSNLAEFKRLTIVLDSHIRTPYFAGVLGAV